MDAFDAAGEAIPFSIVYSSFSLKRKSGGKPISIRRAILYKNLSIVPQIFRKDFIPSSRLEIPNKKLRSEVKRLYCLDTRKIYPCYFRFVCLFNGQEVTY